MLKLIKICMKRGFTKQLEHGICSYVPEVIIYSNLKYMAPFTFRITFDHSSYLKKINFIYFIIK